MRDKTLITFERRSGILSSPLGIAAMILFFILGVVGMGDKFSLAFLLLFVVVLVILPVLAKKSLVSVSLDENNKQVIIVLNRWGRVYKELVISIASLDVLFKDVRTGTGKRKVLQLFHNKTQIASATDIDGWETETLEKLAAAINGLKRK
jgi:hypothetical protein